MKSFCTFCLLFLFVFVHQVSPQTCTRTEKLEFTCIVGSCEQTIEVDRCRALTIGELACANCLLSKLCCGIPVCSAVLGGPCDIFVPPEPIAKGLRVWSPERMEWAYVSDCRGHWVRLSLLAERIGYKKKEETADVSTNRPDSYTHGQSVAPSEEQWRSAHRMTKYFYPELWN